MIYRVIGTDEQGYWDQDCRDKREADRVAAETGGEVIRLNDDGSYLSRSFDLDSPGYSYAAGYYN